MKTLLTVLVFISSIIIIGSVLMQESKSDGFSGIISGGAEELFGKKKSRGYETILFKLTIIASIVFFAAVVGFIFL